MGRCRTLRAQHRSPRSSHRHADTRSGHKRRADSGTADTQNPGRVPDPAEIVSWDHVIQQIGLALPRRGDSDFEETFRYKTFEAETPFSIYAIPIEDVQPLQPPIQETLDAGIAILAVKLANWATPSRKNAPSELARAILDPSKREHLQTGVHVQVDAVRYWKIAPGEGAWQWDECRQEGFIAIGWDELSDLSGKTDEQIKSRWDEVVPT